jgi:hypothetical protein
MSYKAYIMGIPPSSGIRSHLSNLCVSPFLTAHIAKGTDFVLSFSIFALYAKLDLILRSIKPLCMMDNMVATDADLALRFMSLAPVLSILALVDIQRLTRHTSINVVEVSRIMHTSRRGDTTIDRMTVTATIYTWLI